MKILTKLFLLALALTLSAQTRLEPRQVRLTIAVVQWAKCTGHDSNVPPKQDCNGLELYRFVMSDGTFRGPFFALLAPAGFAVDANWQTQPLPEAQ